MKIALLVTFACLVGGGLAAPPQSPYAQFLDGILTTLEPAVNGSVQKCIPDTNNGFNDTQTFINLLQDGIEKGDLEEVIESWQYLVKALGDLNQAAIDCNEPAIAEDFRQLVQQLLFEPLKVLGKLLPRASELMKDAQQVISNWNSGNYFASGSQLGNILAIILPPSTRHLAKATADPFEQFVDGLLTAIEPAYNGSIGKCIPETNKGYSDTQMFFSLLQKAIADANITALLESWTYLEDALAIIQQAAKDCNEPAIANDVQTLIETIASDPTKVFWKLVRNSGTIMADAQQAIADWQNNNFEDAGRNIGSILVIILIPDSRVSAKFPAKLRIHRH